MDFLPWTMFVRIVDRYDGNRRVRTLPCAEHFRVLAFAQLTYRESLRDVEACLSAQSAKLYHMGIRSPIKRPILADANERRDWRFYAEFAQRLVAQAHRLYAEEDLGLDLSSTVYALFRWLLDGAYSLVRYWRSLLVGTYTGYKQVYTEGEYAGRHAANQSSGNFRAGPSSR